VTPDGPRYATAAAFRKALNHQLRVAARSRGRPEGELRRQFLTHRFLARVFGRPASGWVLLGGVGLLVRIPGARATKDIDLLHTTSTVTEAVLELEGLLAGQHLDPLTFQVTILRQMYGRTRGADIAVTALLGPTVVGTFRIDLTIDRTPVGQAQLLRPPPVIDIDDVGPLPEFVLYPLEDQVADKLCAMYDRYGPNGGPSTRVHDLVDLVLIARRCSLDAAQTRLAIIGEQHRRGLTVPAALTSPGPTWDINYQGNARDSILPPDLHNLENALTAVRTFLGPVLTGVIQAGQWQPDRQEWV